MKARAKNFAFKSVERNVMFSFCMHPWAARSLKGGCACILAFEHPDVQRSFCKGAGNATRVPLFVQTPFLPRPPLAGLCALSTKSASQSAAEATALAAALTSSPLTTALTPAVASTSIAAALATAFTTTALAAARAAANAAANATARQHMRR